MLPVSCYPYMPYHCFLVLSPHNHLETLLSLWDPLQTKVSCWLGQPNSSPIPPSGLTQTSICPTFCFPCSAGDSQATDCTLTGLSLPSHLSLSRSLSRSSLQFFWNLVVFFFSYLSEMMLPVNIPLEEEWSIFLLTPWGDIYRRLLLDFFLGLGIFFSQSFPRSTSHI